MPSPWTPTSPRVRVASRARGRVVSRARPRTRQRDRRRNSRIHWLQLRAVVPIFSMTVFSRGQDWGHEVVAKLVLVPRGARRDGRGGRRSLGAPHQGHRPRHGRWWRVHSGGVVGGRPARSWWLLVFLADQRHKVIERLLRKRLGISWEEFLIRIADDSCLKPRL